jgi:hypothetical protein
LRCTSGIVIRIGEYRARPHGQGAKGMTFDCDGVRYDSSTLINFTTGDPYEPFIYMTPDHARVFVGTMERWAGFNVRPADDVEIRRLATRFGLPELRWALKDDPPAAAPPGVALPADAPDSSKPPDSDAVP